MDKEANEFHWRRIPRVRITKHVFPVVLLLVCLNLPGADFRPFAGPKPIAVFIQTDPWAEVIGSETPRVAVYEDGTAIWRSDRGATYYSKKLSEQELSDFKKHLAPVLDLKALKRSYSLLPGISDQPEALFYIRTGERELAARVIGLKARGTRLPAYSINRGENQKDQAASSMSAL